MCMKGCTQESYTRGSFMTHEETWEKARRPGWNTKINFAAVETAKT